MEDVRGNRDVLTELFCSGGIKNLKYYLSPLSLSAADVFNVQTMERRTSTSICLRYESSIVGSYRSIQTP